MSALWSLAFVREIFYPPFILVNKVLFHSASRLNGFFHACVTYKSIMLVFPAHHFVRLR